MWLLSTDRAELHHFPSPDAVTGGYAILSHTWGKDEQTFQKTQALRERCERTGENPRDLSSEKVRESCILAKRHGYKWLWNDTCCIDKTSSTELSEAINSMFLWYSFAEVCFAYLGDVDSNCQLDAPDSAFRTARWHSRGWTLQELIAPFLVIFVSGDWETIGNKQDLSQLLEEITGVRRQVLTGEMHYSVPSIAERMSWASQRNTTRVEDEAYCLMGMFNINMPTLYGEGRQAFQRLQQEIMKQSIDTSLFAWDDWVNSLADDATPIELPYLYKTLEMSSFCDFYLLAESPADFVSKRFGRGVRYTPSVSDPLQPYLDWQWETNAEKVAPEKRVCRPFGPFGRIELPKFSFTHYGVECRFPIIESDGLTIAVLLCDNGREHIGLLLCPSNDPVQDPSRKKYHTAYCFQSRESANMESFRLISLGSDLYNLTLRLNGTVKTVTAEWRDIFILDSPPPIEKDVAPSRLCFPLHSIKPAPPFRLPHWLVGRLAQVGLPLLRLGVRSYPYLQVPLHLLVSAIFEDVVEYEKIIVTLGMCKKSRTPEHWAKVLVSFEDTWNDLWDHQHDCGVDHIAQWPDWTKNFGDARRSVQLSFSRWSLAPDNTLVVHVKLQGEVYDAMKKRRNVELPVREALGLAPEALRDVGAGVVSPHLPVTRPRPAAQDSIGVTSNRTSRDPRRGRARG